MGIYVQNKRWKFRIKFPIRLGENQIFVVVRFFSRTLYRGSAFVIVYNVRRPLDRLFALCEPVTLIFDLLT